MFQRIRRHVFGAQPADKPSGSVGFIVAGGPACSLLCPSHTPAGDGGAPRRGAAPRSSPRAAAPARRGAATSACGARCRALPARGVASALLLQPRRGHQKRPQARRRAAPRGAPGGARRCSARSGGAAAPAGSAQRARGAPARRPLPREHADEARGGPAVRRAALSVRRRHRTHQRLQREGRRRSIDGAAAAARARGARMSGGGPGVGGGYESADPLTLQHQGAPPEMNQRIRWEYDVAPGSESAESADS
jgi:hypothetical protein